MCSLCGKELVPALKESVKETGRQLRYIAKLSGDEENEFFRSLATDESKPEKVRVEAISALSCSPENGALLAEIFNTSKGKLKDAALMTLAEMDAPEAEPIFEKLLKKIQEEPCGSGWRVQRKDLHGVCEKAPFGVAGYRGTRRERQGTDGSRNRVIDRRDNASPKQTRA